jgi:hypothetical protein
MPADADAEPDPRQQTWHVMLLRLAGKAPDDLVTSCRSWLADGDFELLARAVSYFVASSTTPVSGSDAAMLARLFEDSGLEASALGEVGIEEPDPFPPYEFAARSPGESGAASAAPAGPDTAEQELLAALAAEPGAIGGWRAWRFPDDGSPWPPPRRVFVIETSSGTSQAGLTARLQQTLATAGESSPQVEVYATGQDLPVYQRLAREYGELIWARAGDPGIKIASVFDSVDAETGPHFAPGHARLDDEEGARVTSYLYGGEPLMITTARMDDVVDATRRGCVPMSFRTDGTWVWPETSAYYTAEHHLAPDPRLLAHIREAGYTSPAVDGVALSRALRALLAPSDEEPVWTVGAAAGPATMEDDPGAQGKGRADQGS